ncbi:MAG: 30S ribosomal protein S3 [Spirochaetes bacterium]|nr:30S ribosomal protein S3 [Spirochaetota bacterium]
MGQKVHPIGFRIGIVRNWDSVWYEDKKNFKVCLVEDLKIRDFIMKNHKTAGIARVIIERLADKINVNIHTARPGMLIGKKGSDIDTLKLSLQKIASKNIYVNIVEVKKPEKAAQVIAQQIAQQIEGRQPYRKAVRQAVGNAVRSNAHGIKVMISGRLNGADIARGETFKEGRVPLHTLRADIDYGVAEALTTYGLIGVKVWVYNGDFFASKAESDEDKYTVKRKTK